MQTEPVASPKALSSGAALIGMLLMLDPSLVFSECLLRNFLLEQSRWRGHFENLFRTRKSAGMDEADGLEDKFSPFLDLLLIEYGPNFKVRCSPIWEVFSDRLRQEGILPFYEERFRRDAEHFVAFVKKAWQ